jgi:hypothetical protein
MCIGGGEIDKKTGKTGKPKGNFIGASRLSCDMGKDGKLIWHVRL